MFLVSIYIRSYVSTHLESLPFNWNTRVFIFHMIIDTVRLWIYHFALFPICPSVFCFLSRIFLPFIVSDMSYNYIQSPLLAYYFCLLGYANGCSRFIVYIVYFSRCALKWYHFTYSAKISHFSPPDLCTFFIYVFCFYIAVTHWRRYS